PDSGAHTLKQAMAAYYKVPAEQVFLGNGSDDVLALSFLAFFRCGKEIVFPEITYSFYPVWCRLFGIPYRTPGLTPDFHLDAAGFDAPNGGVVFPNPNAPTGIGEGLAFIRRVLDANRDCVVIVDEAYVDFGGESALPLVREYDNLLVVGTFSKSRSLAGLRIAYAIGSPLLISTLEAVKNSYNSYTIDSLSMAAATASLEADAYFRETIGKVTATRTQTTARLRALDFAVLDSCANFVLAAHPRWPAKKILQYLKEQNIYVRHFDTPKLYNYLRISIGTDAEMDALFDALQKFQSSHPNP
ncbi:MAG: aminotransferase class I/II-fold pyridoxal phosphate-dependent enzyme, partial [Clostridiales bacterium]|nr:aminotransferase class I/II-fold pyridoxal phosphate-dependent enzyme [Clostridiales bacterium]